MTAELWTSADAAVATGGKTQAPWAAGGVAIDTRSLMPGDLFVALNGARDGHDFVGKAFEAGAAAALVARDLPKPGGPLLVVDDVLGALEALGVAARARSGAIRFAVTGSVGKTSVKEMLAQIFRATGQAHWSVKSFNNHLGVPLTLARMPQNTERAVFEVGMSTPGEIAPRSHMARPHCAIITKIAAAHLEGLGSVEGVAREKADIFAGLELGGAAILPAGDAFLGFLKAHVEALVEDVEVLTFGFETGADAQILDYTPKGHAATSTIDVMGTAVTVNLQAGGEHWALNAAAALLACVSTAKLSAEEAAAALNGFAPPKGRGQIETLALPSGGTFALVDDSYNANPTSMRAALGALAERPAKRRILALGAMGELGEGADQMHADLAGPVISSGADIVFMGGAGMAALSGALPITIQQHFEVRANDLWTVIKETLCDGDTLLIKGSNASGMVQLAEALRQWSVDPDQQVMEGSATCAAKGM